jgi:hypothetical protein
MSGKQVDGIACFVLAAALLVSGIKSIVGRADLADPSGVDASFVVGATRGGAALTTGY